MAFDPSNLAALAAAPFDTVIDVRSPSEFAEDHVPGAINLPVLSDAERAEVGTIYVQDSAFRARKIGAALVARNAARHLEGPLANKDGSWQPLVYCWRGGQRSGSFASILSQVGWRADVLTGGYQTYRRHVGALFYENAFPYRLILLDGNTGTAKTDILKRLVPLGVQVLDLERVACHRGSALGGQGVQPSQKAFESTIAASLTGFDPERPVVVEAESSKIGQINLPPKLFDAMRRAPRITVEAPVVARAKYLAHAYRDLTADVPALEERLSRLVRLQGWEVVARWTDMAREGEFEALALELIERHYDPRYSKVRERVGAAVIGTVQSDRLEEGDLNVLADQVADLVGRL